jgi:small subunit ribosomal protein S17
MAEEEKREERAEAGEEQAPATDQAPAAEGAEDAPEAETEEEAPATEAREPESPAEASAAPGEQLSPKQRRKRERSRAPGEARAPRTPEERAAERAERRRMAAERRRRYRAARRAKHGEPKQGTPPTEREPGSKKVRQGTVVSAAADKTITVEIPIVRRHRTYEKVVRRTNKLHAHDESNTAQEGDVVRVIESRPISRSKRWRLLDVVERSR